MNTDEGLSQLNFFMPPPTTKQYECWTDETNWDLEQILKFIPPWPWSWHVESSHCYKLARLSPTKKYIRSTLELTWHLESWFKCHFFPLQQNNTSNKLKQFILSHFWKLRPPDPTQQHVKHVKNWHIESFCRFRHCPLESTTFNIWTNVASWVMFKMYSLFLKKQYVEYTYEQSWNVDLSWNISPPLPFQFVHSTNGKKCILSHFCNLQPPRPYKIGRLAHRENLHVASVFKVTLLDLTKHIVEHFGILPTPWP